MMKFKSLNGQAPAVSFKETVINGLAPDHGLYFPEKLPLLSQNFLLGLKDKSDAEIALETIKPFVSGDIPESELSYIVQDTLSFAFPLVRVSQDIFSLELFHGPTLAFKDVGARFMARCLGFFNSGKTDSRNVVLVATSGDTGGAVASGFLGVEGVEVVILYPKGKVSDVQERQLTTLGQNIRALRVDGTFDDCQAMVKKAFTDDQLSDIRLTSANSINIARWLPQMWYFFFAFRDNPLPAQPLIISCPSGNFGNIASGVLAKKTGLPVERFVASVNANDTVPRYLNDGNYLPEKTIPTISNAMDVSDPSNFVRILEMYRNNRAAFLKDFSSYSFSDDQTREAMAHLQKNFGYTADPHGAVAYLGLKTEMDRFDEAVGTFLETAHPCKFGETVGAVSGVEPNLPPQVQALMHLQKTYTDITSYQELTHYLKAI